MKTVWEFFVEKNAFTYLLITAALLSGLYAMIAIPKESSPEVEVPFAIVTTILPGSPAESVERLLTNPIEDEVETLENVKTYTSTSGEGVSNITVEFNADADIDKSIQNLKDAVDRVKSTLPSEAQDPIVTQIDFVNQPIIIAALSGPVPTELFTELAEDIKSEIKRVNGVARVEISGIKEREIQVIIDSARLSEYGLSAQAVSGALQAANVTLPVGSAQINNVKYSISFDADITDVEELRNIPITTAAGTPILLRDVATVIDGTENAQFISRVSIDGEPSQNAVSLSIYKRSGADITRVSSAVTSRLDELTESQSLRGLDVVVSYNAGDYVRADLKNLTLTALQTIALVFIILLLALGIRESLLASFAIPLSFLITFMALLMTGNTINFISLFSLILAVGILVDTAIVMTEAIHEEVQEGIGGKQAAIDALRTYAKPLIAGTLTTVAVFAPLFFLSGITGEFIASIPFTIIFVLFSSLFVALGLLPTVASRVLTPKKDRFEHIRVKYTKKIEARYEKLLRSIIGNTKREKWLIRGSIIALIVSLALPAIGLVQVVFFPGSDVDFIYIDVETPENSALELTDMATLAVEEQLYDLAYIDSFVTTVGSGSVFGVGGSGSDQSNITVNLSPSRSLSSEEIMQQIREHTQDIPGADVRVSQPSEGPPVGAPISLRVEGSDLDEVASYAAVVERTLKETEGTRDVSINDLTNTTEISITVDRGAAARLGVSLPGVATTLRSVLVGLDSTSIDRQGERIDIRAKTLPTALGNGSITRTDVITPDELRRIPISTQAGTTVLLGSFADIELAASRSNISHRNGNRSATIESQLEAGYTLPTVLGNFYKNIESSPAPKGIELVAGGESEETQQSFKEMFIALIAGILLMLIVLILQFNSFRQTFYILVIVPFSLIGVMVGLALTRQSLSFPSLMGIIALAGIIVNNSIILIDRMNALLEETDDLEEVVIQGGLTRLRPILLTTATTVIGVIPLTYASSLWGPLAWSIIFGLTFSVFLTLILVPVLYYRKPGIAQDN